MTSSTQTTVLCVTSTPSCFLSMWSISSSLYMDIRLLGLESFVYLVKFRIHIYMNVTEQDTFTLICMLCSIWKHLCHICAEILLSSRYHRVPVGGPGSRGFPGHAAHAVRHHDSGPGSLPEKVPAGKVCFPGGAGVWHSFLDVFHPPWGHWEVRVHHLHLFLVTQLLNSLHWHWALV